MISCSNIRKVYHTSSRDVIALDDISLSFGPGTLTAVLGPSGCGKTTLLNALGGLDRDVCGSILIDGVDANNDPHFNWDDYRRHHLGFVFQEFDLIEHLDALDNIRAALALAGIPEPERTERSTKMLARVGLADLPHALPAEMSGGQKQRVAIARAMARAPEFILADEPTGSLDGGTAQGIMELLRSIADDGCTVVMVTHDTNLARQFAHRIVRLEAGHVIDDDAKPTTAETPATNAETATAAVAADDAAGIAPAAAREPASSEPVAPDSPHHHQPGSIRRLAFLIRAHLTVKWKRNLVTVLVAAIGAIGIFLLGGLVMGALGYIDDFESDLLVSYPITIEDTDTISLTDLKVADGQTGAAQEGTVKVNDILSGVFENYIAEPTTPDLTRLRFYLQNGLIDNVNEQACDIQYRYDIPIDIYDSDTSDGVKQLKPSDMFDMLGSVSLVNIGQNVSLSSLIPSDDRVWRELVYDQDTGDSAYTLLAGRMPTSPDEVVFITGDYGRVDDFIMYALGFLDIDQLMAEVQDSLIQGTNLVSSNLPSSYSYDQIIGHTFSVVPSCDRYEEQDGCWVDKSDDEAYLQTLVQQSPQLKIVGIVKSSAPITIAQDPGGIGYTSALPEYLIEHANESAVVQAQRDDPLTDVMTGKPFSAQNGDGAASKAFEDFDFSGFSELKQEYMQGLTDDQVDTLKESFPGNFDDQGHLVLDDRIRQMAIDLSDEDFTALYEKYASRVTTSGYGANMLAFGAAELDKPTSIVIYPKDISGDKIISAALDGYNADLDKTDAISYVDETAMVLALISPQLSTGICITIAIAIISLIVLMVMIGSMTHVAVIERAREIGILRSLGASKRDICWLFISESAIQGFLAGICGIVLAALISLPLKSVLTYYAGIDDLVRFPPPFVAGLLLLCVLLSMIASIGPSLRAARRDPVSVLEKP